MNENQPIDLSELQQLTFRPDWVEGLSDKAAGADIVWGYSEENRGGSRGERPRQGGDRREGRGPRRDGGNRPEFRDQRGPRRDGPRPARPPGSGQRQDRGPQTGGPRPAPAGPHPIGPRDERRGPRSGGPNRENRGPRPEGAGRPENRGARSDRDSRRDGGHDRGPRNRGERDFRGRGEGFVRPALPHGWNVRLVPEPRGVENLSKQIKATGRAYSIFDIARLFLSSPDRYLLHFFYKVRPPKPQGKPAEVETASPPAAPGPAGPTELLQCTLDGSLWFTREEALRHCRESGALKDLYREETVEVDAPKGNYTSIAVCGFSGTLLGPPNHHAYQANVARLHRERFSNMSIDRYKNRIEMRKDEETVRQWVESQSREVHYIPTQVPEGEEPPVLKSLAERDAHFMRHHADSVLRPLAEITVPGTIGERKLSPGLQALLRVELDRQQRFPITLVQDLCRELEHHGLRFFKHDKKTTFVCRSRPHFISADIVLSERVRSIIEMVRTNPRITYSMVVSLLAPSSAQGKATKAAPKIKPTGAEPAAPTPSVPEAGVEATVAAETSAGPTDEAPAVAEDVTLSKTETAVAVEKQAQGVPAPDSPAADEESATKEAANEVASAEVVGTGTPVETGEESAAATESAELPNVNQNDVTQDPPAPAISAQDSPPKAENKPEPPPLSAEEIAVMQDLKWLVQEGYITEFSNGELHILGREHPHEVSGKSERPRKAKKGSAAVSGGADSTPAADATPSNPSEDAAPTAETEVLTASELAEELSEIPSETEPTPEPAIESAPQADETDAAASHSEEPAVASEAPEFSATAVVSTAEAAVTNSSE